MLLRGRGAREIRFPHSRRLEAATGQAAGQEAAAPEACDGGRRATKHTLFDAGRAPSRPQICEKWTRTPFALATVDAAPAKRLARTFRSLTVMFRRRPKAAHASRTSESPRNVTTLTRRRARHASAAGPGKRRTAQSPRANAQPSAERRQWPGPGSRHGASGFFGDGAATAVNVFGAKGTAATFAHSSSVKGCARPQRPPGQRFSVGPRYTGSPRLGYASTCGAVTWYSQFNTADTSYVPASGGTQRTRSVSSSTRSAVAASITFEPVSVTSTRTPPRRRRFAQSTTSKPHGCFSSPTPQRSTTAVARTSTPKCFASSGQPLHLRPPYFATGSTTVLGLKVIWLQSCAPTQQVASNNLHPGVHLMCILRTGLHHRERE